MAPQQVSPADSAEGNFEAMPLQRFDFHVRTDTPIAIGSRVETFLSQSGVSIDSMDPKRAMRCRLARFQEFSFGHSHIPQSQMTWSRRKAGSERALIIIVNSGRMRVSQVPGVVERDPGVYFIPPGSAEVVMTFESESNEIVFLSASSGLIADLLARGERASKQPAIGTHVLAPLYAFAANVCRIPIDSVSGSEPLKAVGAEVIRSIVRLVVGDGERVPQLYLGAMETIVSQYPNPAINAPEIARRFGISLRTLQLEFQGHGTTVSAEIRRVRTKAARRIKAANPKITPQELCDSVGFGSLSAMFRALRETTEE